MPASRNVIVAGAGIAGLTTALALARSGFRVSVLEQAERLEETGAGVQLSPNATRVLLDLGLAERLRPHVVVPEAVRVRNASSGRDIVRIPLGGAAQARYGAPYWSIHRGDLQATLAAAAAANVGITLKLGTRLDDFMPSGSGIAVSAQTSGGIWQEHGEALLAADGLWSVARARIGRRGPPRFAGRAAWRALIPAADAAPEFREPLVQLWLGRDAHLVHYPVKGGTLINVVVIADDAWHGSGWSEPASRDELLPRLRQAGWSEPALRLFALPDHWLKWALFDRRPLSNWSQGAAALIGDAAHPMLPYLAQGAAMAIEDAAVVARCLAAMPENPAAALRAYCVARRRRARKVQRLAARNGTRYHRSGLNAALRDAAMRLMGGPRLLHHYDWLYAWQPPAALSLI